MFYQDDQGKNGLRIEFDLVGCRRQAKAQVDAREVKSLRYFSILNDTFLLIRDFSSHLGFQWKIENEIYPGYH